MSRPTKSATKKPRERTSSSSPTIVWGTEIEADDFLKVPRTVLRLARYLPSSKLKARHIVLLLSLASRKFQKKKIRVYWEELADDIGVSKNTVRKWAYELKKLRMLKIIPHRGRDLEGGAVGTRNERNEFDLTPFIEVCATAYRVRKQDRERANGSER